MRWTLRRPDHAAIPTTSPSRSACRSRRTASRPDEFETVNHASALWTRPKSELKDEEYQIVLQVDLGHDFNDALAWTHNRVEGAQSFTALLYVPEQPPFDLMISGRDERKGLKLYIRRVFIMDASEQLLPTYLRFVRGVVDSDDLPLNVSREILQENRLLAQIKAACVKRVLDLLEKLAARRAGEVPRASGRVRQRAQGRHRRGHRQSRAHRQAAAFRLDEMRGRRRRPSRSTTMSARMPVGQDVIWYITADRHAAAARQPADRSTEGARRRSAAASATASTSG